MDKKTPGPLSRNAFGVLLLAVTAGALAFRLPQLERRPMHCDEAVHAVKVGELLESGAYVYDPSDYHGPTIYYLALPSIWLSGARNLAETRESTFRIVPVVFGVGLVLLVVGLADGLGRRAALAAALLTAASPAMVFYSRYYIQEMAFVFFTFAAIVSGWRYASAKTWGWALITGACLGLMHATKETAVLAYAAMAGALVLERGCPHPQDERPQERGCPHPQNMCPHGADEQTAEVLPALRGAAHPWHVVMAVAVALGLSALFMSGFLTHSRGILDSWLTYASYLSRADGAGLHDHPWYYYCRLLLYFKNAPGPWWSEGFIVLLGVVGIAAALRGKVSRGAGRLVRFLAFYTLILTVLYAVIPYKTPWCALGFLHGWILMAGVGAVVLLGHLRKPWMIAAACAVLLLGVVHLGRQAYRAAFVYAADTRNPYVYAHSSTDVVRLAERVEAIAAIHPDGRRMIVKVIAPEYWPLPWYLRRLERVGYWNVPPDDPDAPVIIISPKIQEGVDARLKDHYRSAYYGLRPGVLLILDVREDLWAAFPARQGHAG